MWPALKLRSGACSGPPACSSSGESQLIEADQCLAQWFNALVDGSGLGLRELCQVVDQQPRTFARVSRCWNAGCNTRWRPSNCCAVCSNVAPSLHRGCFRLSATSFFVVGCRAAAGPVDLIARTRTGLWCPVSTDELVFPRQDGSSNVSWFVLLRLPSGESLDQVWVNGCSVPWKIQQLQGWPYLEAVDRLLSFCRDGQVPLRSLPHVLQGWAQHCWSSVNCVIPTSEFIQRSQRIGRPARDAELTLVIPLYGCWELIRVMCGVCDGSVVSDGEGASALRL